MTLIANGFGILKPVLGERLVQRIRDNLPSRKPQLWERLPRALCRRAEVAWRARFDPRWPSRPVIVSLPEFHILMEFATQNWATGLALFQYGVYEISGTRFVQSVLKPGMTMVDVGANSGYYSLIAARLVGSQGHVHAFEPAGGPFESLKRNLALNNLQNISIRQAAVADCRGRSTLYPSAVESNDGLGSLIPGPNRLVAGEDVPVISLDDFAEQIPTSRVHLIKVDVEGSEAEVFAGSHRILCSREAPALLFESFNIDPVVESLARFGYEVRGVHYSLRNGLEFPGVGESFDNLFAAYEAPNYVALKPSGQFASFQELSARSRHAIPAPLRLLAAMA